MIELHQDDDQEFYIKWLYDDIPLVLGDFWSKNGECKAKEFIKLLESKTSLNISYDEVCSEEYFGTILNPIPVNNSMTKNIFIGILIFLSSSLILIFIEWLLKKTNLNRNKSKHIIVLVILNRYIRRKFLCWVRAIIRKSQRK